MPYRPGSDAFISGMPFGLGDPVTTIFGVTASGSFDGPPVTVPGLLTVLTALGSLERSAIVSNLRVWPPGLFTLTWMLRALEGVAASGVAVMASRTCQPLGTLVESQLYSYGGKFLRLLNSLSTKNETYGLSFCRSVASVTRIGMTPLTTTPFCG